MYFSTELLLKMMIKQPGCHKNVSAMMQFKYFHDSLNILFILAPGCELFSGKCVQFPLRFTKLN